MLLTRAATRDETVHQCDITIIAKYFFSTLSYDCIHSDKLENNFRYLLYVLINLDGSWLLLIT